MPAGSTTPKPYKGREKSALTGVRQVFDGAEAKRSALDYFDVAHNTYKRDNLNKWQKKPIEKS